MINFTKNVRVICVSLLFLLGSGPVLAQYQDTEPGKSGQSQGRFYGKGQPKTIEDLPPGQLRKSIQNLGPYAKSNALKWLQDASFPAEDVKNLRVRDDGSVLYADTVLPNAEEAAIMALEAETLAEAADISQVFRLHSRPGASNVVFLDFDGHTIEGTAWNSDGNSLVALPFDPSGNDNPSTEANFTQLELDRIAIIWHRMAEDFAAFNVDVTTEEPEVFTQTTGRVLFTHYSDASGQPMPSQNAGGTAFLDVFGGSSYVTKYSPAFVYYSNLSGVATYNAEAGSHEFGHNVGLSHDGVIDGTSYYTGSGGGDVDWAPIMGNSYSAIVTPWSKGEYPNANNTEDDLAILAGALGYAGDDHGDSLATATPLIVEASGEILVSSPELDPNNVLTENKGIIDDSSDVDVFYLDVADGSLNIIATPAWHSFGYTARRGANLDIELTLLDSNGDLVILDEPTDRTDATLVTSVTAGRYYLQISGVGNTTNSDYSDYSSLGMYFIEGSVQIDTAHETLLSPTTMSWQTPPFATGENTFSMTATQATANAGDVEYYFKCVSGGNGCNDSGWQSSTTWAPNGLDADTYYAYNVKARDQFGNENSISPTMGDTTNAPARIHTENEPPSAVASYNPAPAVITKGKSVSVSFDSSNSSDADGLIFSWEWKDSNGNTVSTNMAFDTKLQAGTHNFTLTVTDDDGASNSTTLSVSVTKGGDDGGGGKPCNPRKKDCG